MKIPNFLNHQFVDKDGYLTEPWKHVLEQLFNELQKNMSDESHIAPSQANLEIAQLNVSELSGGLLYNTDTKKLIVNIDGTFKDVLTT
jgi:hypothetical protein